jgi:hypothetical protein
VSTAEAELRRALEAARGRVGALITERTRALEEARRLRARAGAAADLAELEQVAAGHEAHAAALAAEVEAARRTAHEAEVALERVRAAEGAGPA